MCHLRNFKVTIGNEDLTTVDLEQRKVALYLKATAESDVGPYHNDYIWIFTVTEAGNAIEQSAEFVDSKGTAAFMQKIGFQPPK